MSNFDPFNPNDDAKANNDENPLAEIDNYDAKGGDSGENIGELGGSKNMGDVDLLGTGTGSSNSGVGGDGEESENDEDEEEEEEEEETEQTGQNKEVGEDLLEMDGWNLRRHVSEAEAVPNNSAMNEGKDGNNTGSVGLSANSGMWAYALNNDGGQSRQQVDGDEEKINVYRKVHNTAGDELDSATEDYSMDDKSSTANAKGTRNNSRRGLFGWGGGNNKRNASSRGMQGQEDLLDDTPSWSNTSSGGGGLFRRRGNAGNTNNNSSTYSDNNSSSDTYGKVPPDGIDEATLAYGEGGITGDADLQRNNSTESDGELVDRELEEQHDMDNELRVGDHIFVWQTYGINPRAYQRHAVVYSVTRKGEVEQERKLPEDPLSYDIDNLYTDNDEIQVTVVSFYHFKRHAAHGAAQASAAASGNRRGKRSGCKREFLHDFIGEDGINKKKPVHKVHYGRQVKKGLLSKASVGTALKKDQPGLILARVQYLVDNPDHLPDHNALSANGECAAMWCVTGRWCTLQGASILQITCAGQAGGALLAGGILSNLTVLVPMPGIWGMAGWWWYVPATVAYPFLVPMLVALGMASLVPLEILRRNRKKWRGITDGMNHEFWSNASPEVKDEYFGVMATAEKEAEMRSFFGVREGDTGADDARYMPVGGAPGGIDDEDEDEDEVLAMQELEKSCQGMAADMDVDLSGKPPSSANGGKGWGSFFRRKDNSTSGGQSLRHMQEEVDFGQTEKEREGIIN